MKAVQGIASVVGVNINSDDIEVIHRAGRAHEGQPRQVLCKCFSRKSRDGIYKNKNKLKDSSMLKNKVFINEDSTPLRRRMVGYIKNLNLTKSVSTFNGRIFCNLLEGKKEKLVIIDKLGVYHVDYDKLGLKNNVCTA